jgi:hypothetical protein
MQLGNSVAAAVGCLAKFQAGVHVQAAGGTAAVDRHQEALTELQALHVDRRQACWHSCCYCWYVCCMPLLPAFWLHCKEA